MAEVEGVEPIDFTPLMNFYAAENNTQYHVGLDYTATTPELKQWVQQWARKGMVMIWQHKP